MTIEAEILAAVKIIMNAALGDRGQAFTAGELGQLITKPARYVEVNVTRRPQGSLGRLDPGPDLSWWRLVLRGVGDTDTNARTLIAVAGASLEFQQLAVGAKATSPIEYETGNPVQPDDWWWSGLAIYTFTL